MFRGILRLCLCIWGLIRPFVCSTVFYWLKMFSSLAYWKHENNTNLKIKQFTIIFLLKSFLVYITWADELRYMFCRAAHSTNVQTIRNVEEILKKVNILWWYQIHFHWAQWLFSNKAWDFCIYATHLSSRLKTQVSQMKGKICEKKLLSKIDYNYWPFFKYMKVLQLCLKLWFWFVCYSNPLVLSTNMLHSRNSDTFWEYCCFLLYQLSYGMFVLIFRLFQLYSKLSSPSPSFLWPSGSLRQKSALLLIFTNINKRVIQELYLKFCFLVWTKHCWCQTHLFIHGHTRSV